MNVYHSKSFMGCKKAYQNTCWSTDMHQNVVGYIIQFAMISSLFIFQHYLKSLITLNPKGQSQLFNLTDIREFCSCNDPSLLFFYTENTERGSLAKSIIKYCDSLMLLIQIQNSLGKMRASRRKGSIWGFNLLLILLLF